MIKAIANKAVELTNAVLKIWSTNICKNLESPSMDDFAKLAVAIVCVSPIHIFKMGNYDQYISAFVKDIAKNYDKKNDWEQKLIDRINKRMQSKKPSHVKYRRLFEAFAREAYRELEDGSNN